MLETPEISINQEGSQDSPKNPWEERLEAQGLSFVVPERFINPDKFPPNTAFDRLSGLAKSNDAIRKNFVDQFAQHIKEGKRWALISGDDDNLKYANGHKDNGRLLGDMVIRYGAAALTQALDTLELSPDASITVVRPGDSADEVIAWAFNITETDLQKIQEAIDRMRGVRAQDPHMDFSITSTVISSETPEIKDKLQFERTRLINEGDEARPWRFFNEVNATADNEVKMKKVAKDLERLDFSSLAQKKGVSHIRKALVEQLGNSRVSDMLFDAVLKYNTVASVVYAALQWGEAQRQLDVWGITVQELKQVKTVKDIDRLYALVIGPDSPEESNSIKTKVA